MKENQKQDLFMQDKTKFIWFNQAVQFKHDLLGRLHIIWYQHRLEVREPNKTENKVLLLE